MYIFSFFIDSRKEGNRFACVKVAINSRMFLTGLPTQFNQLKSVGKILIRAAATHAQFCLYC